jgi:hypothetical protein
MIKNAKDYPLLLFWIVLAVLYAPAWRAGFVTDAIDWLYDARTLPFNDYLNRPHSAIHALYQTTQLVTLGVYKIFGTARLPWYLLFVTLQALAAYLLFFLCYHLFGAASMRNRWSVAFGGAMLFCMSPYISEVLVWKACFHYLQGLILILSILICVERYIYTQARKCVWIAAALFLLSSFSLEVFYLTPFFTATLLYYYRRLGWHQALRRRTWLLFLLPQIVIWALHLFIFHLTYGEWGSHGTEGALAIPFEDQLSKAGKYIYHLLLFGRYWPQEAKEKVYVLLEKTWLLYLILFTVLVLVGWLGRRAYKGYGRGQVSLLLFTWTLLALALTLPLSFEKLFDLPGNRYLYLAVAFSSMLLSLLWHSIRWRWLKVGLACGWIGLAVFLTLRTNRHWQTSERISRHLLESYQESPGKTTVLLSMPYCYKGIPMVNAWPNGNFARMREVLLDKAPKGKIYDGMAANMIAPSNGSEAAFVNDSTVKVTLLQWCTWWWYMDFGGYSYDTPDYRIDMRDQGHWYEMILKKPADQYQLLYQVGDKWHVVQR